MHSDSSNMNILARATQVLRTSCGPEPRPNRSRSSYRTCTGPTHEHVAHVCTILHLAATRLRSCITAAHPRAFRRDGFRGAMAASAESGAIPPRRDVRQPLASVTGHGAPAPSPESRDHRGARRTQRKRINRQVFACVHSMVRAPFARVHERTIRQRRIRHNERMPEA